MIYLSADDDFAVCARMTDGWESSFFNQLGEMMIMKTTHLSHLLPSSEELQRRNRCNVTSVLEHNGHTKEGHS